MIVSKRYLTLLIASLTLVIVSPNLAQARAWEWAKRLPINQMSPEDIEILKQSMSEILDSLKDGESGKWHNPETGHGGSITPLSSVQQADKRCRQTRFSSRSDGQENISEYFLCRQPDGVWAVEQPKVQ